MEGRAVKRKKWQGCVCVRRIEGSNSILTNLRISSVEYDGNSFIMEIYVGICCKVGVLYMFNQE